MVKDICDELYIFDDDLDLIYPENIVHHNTLEGVRNVSVFERRNDCLTTDYTKCVLDIPVRQMVYD